MAYCCIPSVLYRAGTNQIFVLFVSKLLHLTTICSNPTIELACA